MPLRFILAPAGGGKTHYCLSSLARLEAADPLGQAAYFILPEQATFIHERLLAEMTAGGGFCRSHVSSFSRLVYHAHDYQHMQMKPQLSEAGKLLLAARVISQQKQHLQHYAKAAAGAGFAAYLVKAAEELATYNISPEQLFAAAGKLEQKHAYQAARINEIALLYRAYQDSGSAGYSSYAENMAALAKSIRAGFLAGSEIFIDGYAEFTPTEQLVLSALFSDNSRFVHIALPIDPAVVDKPLATQIFGTPLHTWQQLTALAEKEGMSIEEPLLLRGENGRFRDNAEFAALEAALAGREQKSYAYEPQHIQLGQAFDYRAELTAIGREIIRLTREEDLRFRDISIITRDTSGYGELIEEIFGAMHIPYFIDAKKPLLLHPLFELVRSALECWAYRPKYEHIMRFCKNALLPISQEEIDIFDNYALAHGLKFWHLSSDKPFAFAAFADEQAGLAEQVEDIRQRATAPLLKLLNTLNAGADAISLTEALRSMLQELQVEQTLDSWAKSAAAESKAEEAAQHSQAWDKLDKFLLEVAELLGDEVLPAGQLLTLLDIAITGLTVSTIPPGLDQVFVASLERSRNKELKAAFVPTLNDGILPRRIVMDSLFSDEDRRNLREAGVALALDSSNRQLQEEYLCYIALTRSGERLYLSYITEDAGGKSIKPSILIRKLQNIFPALTKRDLQIVDEQHLVGGELDLAETAQQLSRAKQGAEIVPFWQDVYAFYQTEPEFVGQLSQLQKGLNYQAEQQPLDKTVLDRLYGTTIKSSVSRIERYRLCPFAYFAGYGLRLQKRRSYELDAASRGELYHQVLAEIGNNVLTTGISWQSIDEEQAASLVDAALEKYLPQLLAGILRSSARYEYLAERIRSTLINSILLLVEHTKRGDFLPVAWELPFGSNEPDSLPAYKISLPDGKVLELSGRIDRVDMAISPQAEQKCYFRIIDYKSGEVSLNREDIMAGLRLQLLVYLQVVLQNADVFGAREARAAGIYYSRVSDAMQNSSLADDEPAVGLKLSGLSIADEEAVRLADSNISGHSQLIPIALGKNGFYSNAAGVSNEQLAELTDNLQLVLQETAGQMLEGLISASPLRDADFDACAYCDYKAVCGFDYRLAKPRKKELPTQDKAAETIIDRHAPQNKEEGEIYETEF